MGKARLLEANSPRRTVSPMDEARVVRSLADDDHLSPTQIAKLLGRGRGWVDRRLTLGRRLAPERGAPPRRRAALGHHRARPGHVCPRGEQPRLAESIVRHGLRTREAEALLATWRAAPDTADPRGAAARSAQRHAGARRSPAVSPLGPTARELQARFAPDRARPGGALAARSHRLPRPRPARPAGLPAAAGRPASSSWPTPFQKENPDHADPRGTAELQRLLREHIPIRAIARRLNRDVKTIRRALGRSRSPSRPAPSKLAPYHALIKERAQQGLRSPRILREIRERGYTGGTTILKDFLQDPGPSAAPDGPDCFHRFETRPGEEAQSDWSPYRVPIATPRDDRARLQPDPLFLAAACSWPSSATSGSRRCSGRTRRPSATTRASAAASPMTTRPPSRWAGSAASRAGIPPSSTSPGTMASSPRSAAPATRNAAARSSAPSTTSSTTSSPAAPSPPGTISHQQCRQWLDTVANVRVHGTTRRRVDEAFAEEQPCLIALPAVTLPAARQETRTVQKDGYIPVDGSYYPVPASLGDAGPVRIRIDPAPRADPRRRRARSWPRTACPRRPRASPRRRRPRARRGRPARAPSRRPPSSRASPTPTRFSRGSRSRMSTLTPIHLRAIDALVDLYGEEAVQHALARAAAYRNFNARAVERILQRAHPTVVPEPALGALSPRPEALGALDDIDSGLAPRLHAGLHAPHRRTRS